MESTGDRFLTRGLTRRELVVAGAGAGGALLLAASGGGTSASAQAEPTPQTNVVVYRNVYVETRDGIKLATDIYMPEGQVGVPLPTILTRTPYGKTSPLMAGQDPSAEKLASRGYVAVVQDKRGRFGSDGVYRPSWNDEEDGFDTIQWISRQPWSNGKVGAFGISYMGHTTIQAAASSAPQLLAGVPAQPATDWFYTGGVFNSGVLAYLPGWNLLSGVNWLEKNVDPDTLSTAMAELKANTDETRLFVPAMEMPYQRFLETQWREVLEHRDDPSWLPHPSTKEAMGRISAPLLHVGSWYDAFIENTLQQYALASQYAVARDRQQLLVGPWLHGQIAQDQAGELTFPDAALDYTQLVLDWNDRWLRNAPPKPYQNHRVIVYVTGEDRWCADTQWPLTGSVPTSIYLSEGKHLSFDNPVAGDAYDSFEYDPNQPHRAPSVVQGAADLSKYLGAANLLVYTSDPLQQPLELGGPVRFTLYGASNATDADWLVEVHDVYPDGRSILLTEGVTRARYRNSRENPEPLTPDNVEVYTLALRGLAHTFKPGHAVRVVVTAGKVPLYERNPNNFVDLNTYTSDDIRVGRQSVYRDQVHPSSLQVHVVQPGTSRTWIANPVPVIPSGAKPELREMPGDTLPGAS